MRSPSRGLCPGSPKGGFVGGDKNGDGAFYPNVGRWFARQGILAVLPNYRLAPHHPWPAVAQDVAAVMTWVRAHLEELVGHTCLFSCWANRLVRATLRRGSLTNPREEGAPGCVGRHAHEWLLPGRCTAGRRAEGVL